MRQCYVMYTVDSVPWTDSSYATWDAGCNALTSLRQIIWLFGKSEVRQHTPVTVTVELVTDTVRPRLYTHSQLGNLHAPPAGV